MRCVNGSLVLNHDKENIKMAISAWIYFLETPNHDPIFLYGLLLPTGFKGIRLISA